MRAKVLGTVLGRGELSAQALGQLVLGLEYGLMEFLRLTEHGVLREQILETLGADLLILSALCLERLHVRLQRQRKTVHVRHPPLKGLVCLFERAVLLKKRPQSTVLDPSDLDARRNVQDDERRDQSDDRCAQGHPLVVEVCVRGREACVLVAELRDRTPLVQELGVERGDLVRLRRTELRGLVADRGVVRLECVRRRPDVRQAIGHARLHPGELLHAVRIADQVREAHEDLVRCEHGCPVDVDPALLVRVDALAFAPAGPDVCEREGPVHAGEVVGGPQGSVFQAAYSAERSSSAVVVETQHALERVNAGKLLGRHEPTANWV